ncbi:MAG TPA: peptidoglycan glycosyltransferase [Clostridiales bacterium]|nr:peptidoglycan glycosyltransferase [Clostridiales bacterium]
MRTWRMTRKRTLFMLAVYVCLALLVTGRVAALQFVRGEDLKQQAYEQHNRGRYISARRGTIYDRNGVALAVSASVETISINPVQLKENYSAQKISEISTALCELAGLAETARIKALAAFEKNSSYELIAPKVDKEIGGKIRAWIEENELSGINVDEDSKRFYPKNNLAAHVIGFTSVDNAGLDGVEKWMDSYLQGTKGKIMSEVDAARRELPFADEQRISPQDGYNVYLTLDETIQYFTQKALENAIEENQVLEGATAIVMDPRNGDILAMVSKPDFNLNSPWAAPATIQDPSAWSGTKPESVKILQETVWRNKAIMDTYEPGSTFKPITAAAGLEEGIVTPDTRVNDKTIQVGGWDINCWKPNFHGDESFREAVYNSCNPVFVNVAMALGVNTFYKYVRAFGFYDKTRIPLYGEAKSIFHKSPTVVDMATASFGQRFQITPIQLASAYCAIANGGTLYRPRLVSALTDDDSNIVKRYEPEAVRTVMSAQTSETLRSILEGVVTYGTGHNAYIKGYRLAGKTGTSETLQTDSTGRYIASFCTFAPADNPVAVLLVILDHPNVYPYTGGMLVAPVAGKLMEEILNYLGVDRRYTEFDKTMMNAPVAVPDVVGMTVAEAQARLKEFKLDFKLEGSNTGKDALVVSQTPKAYMEVAEESVIILYTEKMEKEATVPVPDLINCTYDDARLILKQVGLNIKATGLGVVQKQKFAAGTIVAKGTQVEVELLDPNTH